jgi:uncharacterized glyoxalase superfamily protein PhnB
MTHPSAVTASVEVAIDPDTAFKVFTEELECWWLQGPINFYDSTRAYGTRMEPGVGGRILEVYDDATGAGLELARITSWEPGVSLAWTSSLDDVVTEVRFTGSSAGTVVRVEATIPEGGVDKGGTSWVRVTPSWFARWVRRRDLVPRAPEALPRLAVAIPYRDPIAAARWLVESFGLELAGPVPAPSDVDDDDDDGPWIEFRVGSASLVVLGAPREDLARSSAAATPWVFVDDLDAHHDRARAAGADVDAPWHHGVRAYEARDLEGNPWTFAQAGPRMLAATTPP